MKKIVKITSLTTILALFLFSVLVPPSCAQLEELVNGKTKEEQERERLLKLGVLGGAWLLLNSNPTTTGLTITIPPGVPL